MPTTTRRVGRWSELVSWLAYKRLAMALAPAIALFGVVVAPATPVQAAYGCSYVEGGQVVRDGGWTLENQEFAHHYNGYTAVPISWGVSAAGIEAQCLLARAGYNPGPIDGIFGPHSQAAAAALQRDFDSFGAGISVDGFPGPQTWPWLRCRSAGPVRCYAFPPGY